MQLNGWQTFKKQQNVKRTLTIVNMTGCLYQLACKQFMLILFMVCVFVREEKCIFMCIYMF